VDPAAISELAQPPAIREQCPGQMVCYLQSRLRACHKAKIGAIFIVRVGAIPNLGREIVEPDRRRGRRCASKIGADGAPIAPGSLLSNKITHGVLMDNLVQIHRLLSKLRSPAWPEDILGKIDQPLAAEGRAIFAQRCQNCHDVIDPATHRSASVAADAPPPTITIGVVPLDGVGTDARQAVNFASRVVDLEKIGGPSQLAYMTAAQTVAGHIVEQWVAQSPTNADLEREVDTGRSNDFRGPQGYRARPLNGLWAAPPYLHNGSVPSLYELLLPPGQRSRTFYVGSWEFDPHSVGLQMGSPFPGAFLFDTRLPGNSNAGHNYGTDLNEREKAALIEYIKTL
jgi:hypothetical protein